MSIIQSPDVGEGRDPQLEATEVFGSVHEQLQEELGGGASYVSYLAKESFKQLQSIVLNLQCAGPTDLPPYFTLNFPDDEPMDKADFLRVIGEQGKPVSEMVILSAAYARTLYNQVRLSKTSLSQMDREALANYQHIATKIFQSEGGDRHYTDSALARSKLTEILQGHKLDMNALHLIAGVGAGEVELSSLGLDLHVPLNRIIATDILPRELLSSHHKSSLTESIASKIHLFDETNVTDLTRLLSSRLGQCVDTVTSTGSSLVNHENTILPLEYFLHFARVQKKGGLFVYESHNYEIDPENNNPALAAKQFSEKRTARPKGSKGVLEAYAQDRSSQEDFGAFMHSYALIRTLARLTGYSFENVILDNPKLAQDFFSHPDWADNPSSPVWKPQDGIYHTFYSLRKTGNTHPVAKLLVNSFYQAFSRRFPEDLPLRASRQV